MKSLILYAYNITNLTDARYFSAWNADYMSFTPGINGLSLSQIKEIIEWLEGPEYGFYLEGMSAEETAVIMHEMPLAIVQLSEKDKQIDQNLLCFSEQNMERADFILVEEYQEGLDKKQLLKYKGGAINLNDLIDQGFSGLAVEGGPEEKTGLKAYEEDLDELMESLLDFRS